MSAPVLDIRGLNVQYGYDDRAVRVLRDVDLTLHAGEVLGIAGESGCGKSTLAYAATRLLPPPGLITGGEVVFTSHRDDRTFDLLSLSDADLRASRWDDTAIVFQGAMNALNPVHRIGRQLVDAIAAHRPEWSSRARRNRANELLEMVGISTDRVNGYPHQLSGGMRQRVMIAMALALEPQVVIMDEPTTALDVVMQRQIVEELTRLRRELGFSVVFITHDVSLLIELADRIAIMYAGAIVEEAPAREIHARPRHPYTHGLLNSFPPLHGPRRELGGIPGSPPDLAAPPDGCAFAARCPVALAECGSRPPRLLPIDGRTRRAACLHHAADAGTLPEIIGAA